MSGTPASARVALFAPYLSPESGGAWQFYLWVARHVRSHVSMRLFAPAELLAELRAVGCDTQDAVAFEPLRADVEASAAWRILQAQAYRRIGRLRIPLYGRLARSIKRRFYGDDLLAHALAGRLRGGGVDVVHVPMQEIQYPRVVSRYPYVINPHDFQHEHFPEFFAPEELAHRRSVWYAGQRAASAIVVHSQQTRTDAIEYLGVPEERVFYAPYGPLDTFPEPTDSDLQAARDALDLPERFLFYPARAWRHKNHLTLLDAMRRLGSRGIDVHAVFTVVDGEHGEAVRERIAQAGLSEQVTIVGRVTARQMGALYRLCTLVVVPSMFEQNSGPMLEAIHFGKAVTVSHLPELVHTLDGAGTVFDPASAAEIADAIAPLWTSDAARAEAQQRIQALRDRMSWEPFVETYRRAYAFAASNPAPRS